ncbi:MAG: DUF916 domain-containing protein [Bifidobacteriaceae bacterium]|jgi:hypothetical protein|nr:DUF916 domain-containing protein [Bifidobacteriaceae bacterium]
MTSQDTARPLAALLAGAAAAVMLAPGAVAWAQDAEDGSVVWSVAPADQDGPDGRHRIELELEPGERATEHLAVTNLSQEPVTFSLVAADGYFTASGRFNMLNRPEESTDAGKWIGIAPQVQVEPDATAVVPFTITVPANAEPGDHAAGVAATIMSAPAQGSGSGLGVTSRFGIRVMTRVTGQLAPGLEISGVKTGYDVSWNPARPGRLKVRFDLTNTGNVALIVTGTVAASGTASFPPDGAPRIELLPGASRHVEVVVGGVWPLVRTNATITAEPVVAASYGAEPVPAGPVAAEVWVWTPPWPQLACLAGLALIVASARLGRSRSRRRTAAMIEQARQDERARIGTAHRPDPAGGADQEGQP